MKFYSGNIIEIDRKRKRFISVLVITVLTNLAFSIFAQSSDRKSSKTDHSLPVASITDGAWLKGDLHVHSNHSKDASNHSLAKIFAYAKSVGFGYIAITDHDNHVLGDVAHHTWADPELKAEDSLLVLYGAEWTTTRGHGNSFSSKPYDHQKFYNLRDQRDSVVGRIKNELGIHLSANHPSGKDHFGYSYDIVNSIEVWNSSQWPKNANAIMIWDDMLSSGRKLTGRGGSDTHHGFAENPDQITKESARARFSYIGTPTTWVFAKSNTSQSVVDALTNGRASISANPFAPRVAFYADLNNDNTMDMMMGDNMKAPTKTVNFVVQLSGEIENSATYTITVIKNGSAFRTYEVNGSEPEVAFKDIPDATERTYYRISVEGPITPYPQVPGSMDMSDNMVALSNPIYFNFDPDF